jgi:SP family general alpha glucoside:H+ symporter-like MFS transporter
LTYCHDIESLIQLVQVVINLPQFRKDFGTLYGRQYIIPASWQLAWNGASLVGLVVGGLLSGMVAEKIGKRYTLAIALGKRVHE